MPKKILHISKRKYKSAVCVNLSEDIVATIDKMVKYKMIKSRSEAVRQMVYYGFPYFIGLHKIVRLIASDNFELVNLDFITPEETELNDLHPEALKQLRKLYPDTPDYKFMNEE